MDTGDAFLATIALSITATMAVTFGIGWFRASRRIRDLERRMNGTGPDTAVAQLESEVAALTAHLEELASGQDFLSRLVSERRPLPGALQPRAATPTPR